MATTTNLGLTQPASSDNATTFLVTTLAANQTLIDDEFAPSTGHDHDGTDSKTTAHEALSAAVHGLPASVNVLGDRTAAGKFIQHAAIAQQTIGAVSLSTYGVGVAVTYPVALSAVIGVAPLGITENESAWGAPCAVTTTGFTMNIYGTGANKAVTMSYLVLGS